MEKLKARLNEWNAEIDRMEAEIREGGGESRHGSRDHIRVLREKTREANEILLKMQESDKNSWQDLKGNAGSILSAFKKNFSKASSEFKRGYKEGMKD
jgi:hypothetical protein